MLNVKKIIKTSSVTSMLWLVFEKILKLFLGVLVSSLLARYMGPAEFGLLNFALAVLAVALILSGLGLNRIVVREVVNSIEDVRKQYEIISTAFVLRLIMSIFLSIALYFFFCIKADDGYIWGVIFFSLIFSPVNVLDLYAQGLSDLKRVSLIRSVVSIVSSFFKIILIYCEVDFYLFYLAVLFECALAAIFLIWLYVSRKGWGMLSFKSFSLARGRAFIKESYPEIGAGLSSIMFFKLDQIMLNYLVGAESVGVYAAATRISEAWYFIPVSVVAATFPFIVKGKLVSPSCYRNRLRLLMTVLMYISVTLALLMTFISGYVVNFLYGVKYTESAQVLVIHCWSGVFVCLGITSGSALAVEKLWHWAFYRTLAGLCVNIFLNYLLILEYGVEGAAWATLISLSIAFFWFDLFFKPMRKLFFDKVLSINVFWFMGSGKINAIIRGTNRI